MLQTPRLHGSPTLCAFRYVLVLCPSGADLPLILPDLCSLCLSHSCGHSLCPVVSAHPPFKHLPPSLRPLSSLQPLSFLSPIIPVLGSGSALSTLPLGSANDAPDRPLPVTRAGLEERQPPHGTLDLDIVDVLCVLFRGTRAEFEVVRRPRQGAGADHAVGVVLECWLAGSGAAGTCLSAGLGYLMAAGEWREEKE